MQREVRLAWHDQRREGDILCDLGAVCIGLRERADFGEAQQCSGWTMLDWIALAQTLTLLCRDSSFHSMV